MCYKEVITTNTCCEGTACKKPGDPSELNCCIDYYVDDPGCEEDVDCCDDNATCVIPAGSDTGSCCIGNGGTCTEDDGGCCVGLLCTGGKCKDCLGLDKSCPSGGLGCCGGLVCMTDYFTYQNACKTCIGEDKPCSSGFYGTSSCCGGLKCVSRNIPGVTFGYQNLCSDCLPATDTTCVENKDCCDDLECKEIFMGTMRWCSNF
jgi:hypothetical protein